MSDRGAAPKGPGLVVVRPDKLLGLISAERVTAHTAALRPRRRAHARRARAQAAEEGRVAHRGGRRVLDRARLL